MISTLDGVDFNQKDHYGTSPFLQAVICDDFETATAIAESSDVDLNVKRSDGMTPLMVSVTNNNLQMVQFLIGRVDLDATNIVCLHLIEEFILVS